MRLLTAALGMAGRADADRRGHFGAAPVEMEKLAGRTSTSEVSGSSRWSWPAWLLTSAALVLSSPSSAQDVTWTSLARGIDVAVWTPGPLCDGEVPPLVLIKVDPEAYAFRTFHYSDEKLPAPLTIKEWQRRTGSTIVFNAGLFRDDYSYMGTLLKHGRSLGSKRHPLWQGLFVAEPNAPGLRKARVVDLALEPFTMEEGAYQEAAQSLMLLDRRGKPRVRQTGKRAHQTIVAEDRDGAIVLMKTTETVALWELAMCLRDGLPAVHQAMVMDGGASSDVLIEGEAPSGPEGGPSVALQPFQALLDGGGMRHIPLPAVIGVVPRTAAVQPSP